MKKQIAFSAALAPLLLTPRVWANTLYTYTPDNATTDTWSSGTGWSPTAPVSSNTTELAFATGFTFTSGFANVNTDDYAGAFNLNAMDLNGTGPTSGTASIAINAATGSNLNFSGTAPVINLNATNGTGLTYTVNAPINFAAGLAINAPTGTATFNFAGPISGTGNLSITGSNLSVGALTVGLSGANTYTGVTSVGAGNFSGSSLTVNVSGNQTGATGGWSIIPFVGSNNVGVGIVNFLAGSQIAVASGKVFQLGNTGATGSTQTLNVAGTVTNAGTLNIQRTAVFNVSSGGVWNQSGGMNILTPNGGNSTNATILAGGIFNYTGTSTIGITPANTSSGSATLTIGGTFNTSAGFAENLAITGTGIGKLALNGGTLLLNSSSNITTLAAAPLAVSFGSGANSIINTNGAVGTNIIGSNINNSSTAAGSVTKAGAGILTFAGIDTYTGTTNISAGTLVISGASSLPAAGVVGFTNTNVPATLDLSALTTQTVGGLVFGFQNASAGTNTVTIKGTSATALTTSPTTLTFAPFNSSSNLLVDMSSVGSFTYNSPTAGTFNVNLGSNSGSGGTNGSSLLKLASGTDSISANVINVGNIGTPITGPALSTLMLGANATLDANTINVGTSKSRGSGAIYGGAGTLTIAGATGGTSTAALTIGQNDSTTASDVITSVVDTSAGTLNAQLSTLTIGESYPNNQTFSRGVTINAGFNMGAGTLSAASMVIGQLLTNSNTDTGGFYYQELVNGNFNITGGTATVPSITLGTSQYAGIFNTTIGSIVNATLTLNTGSTLLSTNISPGQIVAPSAGTLTVNSNINWNDGTIANIAGGNLNISGVSINLAGASANHALTISAGQIANISSVINGSSGTLTINGAGTVNLLSANLYAGPTNLTNGILLVGVANALSPNSAINISGGTLDASAYVNTISALTIGSAGTLDLGYGNVLTVTGAAAFGGALNLAGTAGTLPETLISYGSESGMFASGSITGIPSGDTLAYTANALQLIAIGSGGPSTLNWTNASGNGLFDTSSLNFNTASGTTVAYSDTSNASLSAGDIVAFTDNNNGSYNVSIPAAVHPTFTTVNNSAGSYTFNGSGGIAGPGGLLKLGTSSLAIYTSNSYTGGTNISAGTVSLYNAHALPAFGSLTINSGASLVANTIGNSYPLQVNGLNLSSGAILDLKKNAAIIRGSQLSAVTSSITTGFNNGTGITSSATTTLTTLGVIINDTAANSQAASGTALYSNFSGGSTADGDILVKYTYYGDANLDGKVDGSDYSLIDSGFLSHATGWYNGDFNYDGGVDGSDYTLIDNAFNTQGAVISDQAAIPTAQVAGSAAVPEPASLSLLSFGIAGLLGRRRRVV